MVSYLTSHTVVQEEFILNWDSLQNIFSLFQMVQMQILCIDMLLMHKTIPKY